MSFSTTKFGETRFSTYYDEISASSQISLLVDKNNEQATGRFLNPITNDYEFDSNGNLIGSQTGAQKILLALKTIKNTSYIDGFGLNLLNNDTIPGIVAKIKQDFFEALKHIKEIEIINLDVIRENSRIKFNLKYNDLTTNKTEVISL